MNHYKISDKIPYKIKVNKKISNNNIYSAHNYVINSYNNNSDSAKMYHMNTYIPSIKYDKNNSALTPSSNNYIINAQKPKMNSNSEEKKRKKNLNINIYDKQKYKDRNILEDLINNKYLQPILESQDIDEKLFNCNLKEPAKNKFNVSLIDFFNRKGKYFTNFKTPKIDMNQKRRGLSIKTHNFNNSNNYINNDILVHNNRTLENNNYNNYYNNIKLTNNYYNNNEINLLNLQPYNNNIMHCSSETKKNKDFSHLDNQPLIYYSYERNKNLFKNKNKTYSNNKNNKINNIHYLKKENNNYNIVNDYNKINSPLTHYFKSQTYSQKMNKLRHEKYINNKPNKSSFTNKEINIRSIGDALAENNKYKILYENLEYKNNEYNNIKNIIKENNSNKKNKYDYNKKLFDIYRGKLINEFFRHIEKVISKYIKKNFNYFIYLLHNLKPLNKIDEIFIPKISLGRVDKIDENKGIVRTSANLKKQKYINIFYSEKKFLQKQNYLIKKNINSLNLSQYNKKSKNINKSFVINDETKIEKMSNNNISNTENKNFQERKYINSNITIANRNSLLSINNPKKNMLSNNIQIINNNSTLNQYIYKKKIRLSKNITFINKGNKDETNKKRLINKDDILSNSKGKIIDIDINLGKPLKEISDISPLENLFINDYNNKRYKSSLSTNKRDKKRKHKSKTKKLSLPKKKYLEEKYDIYPLKNEEEDFEDNMYNNKNNSFDKKLNDIINLNNSYSLNHRNNCYSTFINSNNKNFNENKKKRYRNILVKNIKTSDKRLFIHINYIFSLSQYNNINNKKYDINLFEMKRNIFFSLIVENINKHQNKSLSNISFFTTINSRNYNHIFEKNNEKMNKTNYNKNNKDKYLLSCVKFIIKNINKVFLKKAYKYLVNILEEKYKNKKKYENNKGVRNTYKKKFSKGKI